MQDDESDRFKFLTGTTWVPVSLLANGTDATGPGGLREDVGRPISTPTGPGLSVHIQDRRFEQERNN